jgi:hypothetical protein
MEDEKPVLEQMTDMMAEAAHVTKEAAKKGREEGQKGRQESYAEEVREEKGREKDHEEKEEVETLNRLSSYCNYAVFTGLKLGGICCGMRRSSPRVCAQSVRPSSSASLNRIILVHKYPT